VGVEGVEEPETVNKEDVDVVPTAVGPNKKEAAFTCSVSSFVLSPKKIEPDVTRLPETTMVPAKTALAEFDPETKNMVSEPGICGF
jgi:hypothetical protein